MPKQPTWVLIAFVATLVFGFLFLTRAYGGCPERASGFTVCTAYEVAKDFKEVFGWAIAMYVAYIAVGPVWKQLELMRVDVDISSIKFLEQEIEALKRLPIAERSAVADIVSYLDRQSWYPNSEPWYLGQQAAEHAGQLAFAAARSVRALDVTFEGGIRAPRDTICESLEDLCESLRALHLTESLEPEDAPSERSFELMPKAEAQARRDVGRHIAEFEKARSQFKAAIKNAIATRTRLISDKKTAMVS